MNVKDYIQGNRSGKEANRLEREAQENPFLHDAIDGFDAIDGNHLSAIENLEKQLDERLQKVNRKKFTITWRTIAAAASVALPIFITASVVVFVAIGIFTLLQPSERRNETQHVAVVPDTPTHFEEELINIRRTPPPPPPPLPPIDIPIPDFFEILEAETETQIEMAQDREIVPLALPPLPPFVPEPPPIDLDIILEFTEVRPEFPGGQVALRAWLDNQIRFPAAAAEMGLHGRVIVQFVVERDGSITNIEVVQSTNPIFNREALRVFEQMPPWIPGEHNGQQVRARFTQPITFRLGN